MRSVSLGAVQGGKAHRAVGNCVMPSPDASARQPVPSWWCSNAVVLPGTGKHHGYRAIPEFSFAADGLEVVSRVRAS